MGGRVRSVKASDSRWLRWEAAALAAGLSVNGWMVRAAEEQAALEEAQGREGFAVSRAASVVPLVGTGDLAAVFKGPVPRK